MSTTNMKRSSSKWDDDISVDHEKRLRLKLIEKTKRRKKDKKNNSDSPYTSPSLGDVDTDDNDSEVNETMSTIYYNPALSGCRSISNYRRLNRIEEGAFGIVFRAQDIASEKIYAIKKLKLDREREGFPITSLREINTILKAQHKNVVTVREIVVGENLNEIFIVMNYVEHDLKTLMTYSMKKPFTVAQVKCLLQQLLNGVRHLHENWIIHRDLKPSNLLLSHSGILKIGDFGLAREYASPLKQYTPLVVTLWYRAPELLLQSRDYYSTAVDLWSVGCIFGELLTMKPLFPGKTETDQIMKIFNTMGTPKFADWPEFGLLTERARFTIPPIPSTSWTYHFSHVKEFREKGKSLLNHFLQFNPKRRTNAKDALEHEYFRQKPLPIDPSLFPSWPAKSEGGKHINKDYLNVPKPPSGRHNSGDDEVLMASLNLATGNNIVNMTSLGNSTTTTSSDKSFKLRMS